MILNNLEKDQKLLLLKRTKLLLYLNIKKHYLQFNQNLFLNNKNKNIIIIKFSTNQKYINNNNSNNNKIKNKIKI